MRGDAMTMKGETVLTGAPHPGTSLEVIETVAGFYLGFREPDGCVYSRETIYMSKDQAYRLLSCLRSTKFTGG